MNQPLASPSLWNPSVPESQSRAIESKPGAYEIKFLLDESLVSKLIPVVQSKMQLDSFADPKTGGYSVEGIYYETHELNVFNKSPGYSQKKFRLRSYSNGGTLFLERKSKRRGIVTKRRIQLEAHQLPEMLEAKPRSEPHPGSSYQTELDWFVRRLDRQMLRPTLRIAYDRVAFLQMDQLGPIRLTIDRSVGCCKFDQMTFPDRSSYQSILDGMCVVEFKYREALPNTFRQFMEEFQLIAQPVSKFCHGMIATGLASFRKPNNSDGAKTC